jgi:DNA-binding NtrC family response regulator
MEARLNPRVRVLVIDDDPLTRRALARVLSGAGHTVTSAECVRDAMRFLSEDEFDVVVTDMYMPDEDGLDALRQVREVRPEIPVVVFSGQLVDEFGLRLREMAVRLGASAAVPKSTDLKEIVEVVSRLAGERRT